MAVLPHVIDVKIVADQLVTLGNHYPKSLKFW